MAFKNCTGRGNRRLGADLAVGEIDVDDPVDQLKVLKTHVSSASGSLCSDEFVDAGAQVLEHKILVSRCFAVVDFLGPLFKWKLNSKSLVDGKGNVQKIEAIDAKVVDRMTFRLDGVARNITGFGDDIGYGVERGRHR